MSESTNQDTGSLMARLRSATAEHHRRAEGRQLQQEMAKGVLPRERYSAYLGELLHVHRGLETALAEQSASRPVIAAVFRSHHRRAADLESDLETHGRQPGPAGAATEGLLTQLQRWAEETPVALLGPLYVLEGSMNGNKFIARALMQAWSLGPGSGFRYLNPYGDEQPTRWAEFRAAMDEQTFTPEEQSAIIGAAQHTFDGLGEIADQVSAAA